MKKVLLISQVGILARDIEMKAMTARNSSDQANVEARAREDDIWNQVEEFVQPNAATGDDDDKASKGTNGLEDAVLDGQGRDELTGAFSQSQQMKIIELLGAWEDPEAETGIYTTEVEQDISVASILQFRQSLAFFEARDMFGYHFGPTDTREHCIESSEEGMCGLLLLFIATVAAAVVATCFHNMRQFSSYGCCRC
jgi:hypothetical protein